MKRVLITGKNSYIGTSVEKWLMKEPDKFQVDTIDMKDESWIDYDFSNYDVVFHVAGIAHIKEKKGNKSLYFKVNRDLAYETAKKAKSEGVKQFIFLSSMSVYGLEKGIIDKDTPLNPTSNYGKSKLQAEILINSLNDNDYRIAILRPPMIYGRECKGNYQRLSKLAKRIPIFPNIENERSMLYIDNLCELIRLIIEKEERGLFYPQNREYVKTSEMVRLIAKENRKKILMVKIFNPFIRLLLNIGVVNKVFGSLVYKSNISDHIDDYRIYEFDETIYYTELRS